MKQYIEKSVIAEEIKRLIKSPILYKSEDVETRINILEYLLSFLDTLEVKEVQEITAYDRGMAEEIIINLKRVEKDYRIDLTKEMEWLRNKVKKGE